MREEHTTHKTAKMQISPIHTKTFLHYRINFSTVLYMGNNFHRNFSRKIVAVFATLYETLDVGLHVGLLVNAELR